MALGVSTIVRRPVAVRLTAAIVVVGAAGGAARFLAHYEYDQRKPAFWRAPSVDPVHRFREYHEAAEALRPMVRPGDRIAYHEAGYVPFVLDLENIDMLGLTSPFIGRAPTADAIFTDVGRYYPLTPEPAHHAVHAYLVYRAPTAIVVRSRWMQSANRGRVPAEILRGYYQLAKQTPSFAIYQRSARPVSPHRVDAAGFLENLAHPAYARRVAVNGRPLSLDSAPDAVPSLWMSTGHEIVAEPSWRLHIDSRDDDAPVHELYIEGSAPTQDVRIDVILAGPSSNGTRRFEHVVRAGQPILFEHRLDAGHPADTIEVAFTSLSGRRSVFQLGAIRLMGQTGALRQHLADHGI